MMMCEKYTADQFLSTDAWALVGKLQDPVVFDVFEKLQKGDHFVCFLSLYKAGCEDKLHNSKTFTKLVQVFNNYLKRESSDNLNMKYGICYPINYLRFMVLVHSSGGASAQQYSILISQLGRPSPWHLWYVAHMLGNLLLSLTMYHSRQFVTNSPDVLSNPFLIFENVAQLAQL